MKTINIPLNIPNVLSVFRLFSFPFVMIFIFLGHEQLFVFFLCFNLFTDILDGWIARRFNQVTEIGSAIDSLADTTTYFLALAGLVAFKWDDFKPYTGIIWIFFGLLIVVDLYPLIKFRKYHSYHTYSAKIGAYLKGVFFVVLFVWGFYAWFFYFIMITGMLIFLESIVITWVIEESRSDVKGLWWVLKENKQNP